MNNKIRIETQEVSAGSYGLHRSAGPNGLVTVAHAYIGEGYLGVYESAKEANKIATAVVEARARNAAPAPLGLRK